VYDGASIENSIENESSVCGAFNDTFVVSDYKSYTLRTYIRDKANNLNWTNTGFTTTEISVSEDGGSSGASGFKTFYPALNWSIVSLSYSDFMDIVLAKDSVKPREKSFLIINEGVEPITVRLECSTEDLNITEEGVFIDICDYVFFESDTLVASPVEGEYTQGKVFVSYPINSSYGDQFNFNIVAYRDLSKDMAEFSKLSVSTRLSIWGLIFKYSYFPLQDDVDPEERSKYPVFGVALLFSFVLFGVTYFSLRKKFALTAFFAGLVVLFVSFGVFLIWL
jgi:hypothetical protein